MSGRDLRDFVTSYRAEDLEKLTVRMKDGRASSKYKPAEYEKLRAMVEAKRRESALIGLKVRGTLDVAKATKESSLLRQHRQAWSRETSRLADARERAEAERKASLERAGIDAEVLLADLLEYERVLDSEREVFRVSTVEPVCQLREDLQYRLNTHQQPQPTDGEQVLQQVNFVKKQQDVVMKTLQTELLALEEDFASLGLEEESVGGTADAPADLEKVPEEVLCSECPYPELRDSLVQAFLSLAETYRSRLHRVRDRLQGLDRFCGWGADDHLLFQTTVGRYPPDLPRRRALYTDMLLRAFPLRTRLELAEHERSWDWRRFTQAQACAVTQGWGRDRARLLTRALVTLEEARHARLDELDVRRDRQHQQDVCARLREQLQQWRVHQEEVARLEAAIAGREQEEEEERLRREQERDAAVRTQQREKLRQFYAEQQRRREELDRRNQQRVAELQDLMDKQSRRDQQRVQFREEALRRRRAQSEEQRLERQRDEEERRGRLEALRNQVAVVAEADPERMMGDTASWRNRRRRDGGAESESDVPHEPPYRLHTYTDAQIVSDPRVRMEQALRQAGLHDNQYAQEVLSGVRPLRPPRRDTESTVFRS